jgi:hypothetical protein
MDFFTAINCMDGRVQEPVIAYLKNTYRAAYIDMITEPGPVRIFDKIADLAALNSIFVRTDISVNRHKSKGIAICAHGDCAGNPVDDSTQKQQLKRAIVFLKARYESIPVIGLWIDADRQVHEHC